MSSFIRLSSSEFLTFDVPKVMGVLNVSPDSFYNPTATDQAAIVIAEKMIDEGVDVIDIGGEASNPASDWCFEPSLVQQRVLAVLRYLRPRFKGLISIDTQMPALMEVALGEGADLINDQTALANAGAKAIVARHKAPVILMHHFKGRVGGATSASQMVTDIKQSFQAMVIACNQAGIDSDRIILDPGFGQGHYGKNTQENFYLLAHLQEIVELGYPVLVGWSRKSMLGDILNNRPVGGRLAATIAVNTIALMCGASLLRVHDVEAAKDAVATVCAMRDNADGSAVSCGLSESVKGWV